MAAPIKTVSGGTDVSAGAPSAPAKALHFPEPLIDRANFTAWGQACRVRQVADKYNDLLDSAMDENLTLDQYMKKNKMGDKTAFLLSCPTFKLTCWPSAFAELGSGFVLYFDFLKFLGAFLIVAFLVQMPAIQEYWGSDNFKMWILVSGKNDTQVLSNFFLFTSPGMLGPKMSESKDVPFCYFVLVCLLCAAVVVHSAWQIQVDKKS